MRINDFLQFKLIDSDGFTVSVLHILSVILILIIARIVIYLVKNVFHRQVRLKRIDKASAYVAFKVFKYILWIITIGLSLDAIGVKITLLIAGSAALLVGIGLGLQNIFNDFVSGVILLFEGNMKVDHVLEFDEMVGKVEEIGIRSTRVRTRDNIDVIVPNSIFVREKVINWSLMEHKTRFHINVGVAYGSDVRLVETILVDIAVQNDRVCDTPDPFVLFRDFGNSSLDFALYFWIENILVFDRIKSDLRFEIDQKFRTNGIQIPFPQQDVYIKQIPGQK